jgi:hypothetical protein
MKLVNYNLFKYSLGLIILIEILSYLAFAFPQTSPWIFGLVSVLAIIMTIYKLEYGVMLIFAELIIGSLGKMFVLEIGGWDITIRMVLWLVVLLVWLAHSIRKRKILFFHSKLFKPYLGLGIIIAWGIVWALIQGNALALIFSDVNNYFYFALIFPIYHVLQSKEVLRHLAKVMLAAAAWVSIKTIVLFYIFSHELFSLQDKLYDWSRFTRLAEITNIDPTVLTSRIFMQSHIWLVFGVFVLLELLYKKLKLKQRATLETIILILSMSAIVMSFSRSFWLAGVVSILILFITLFVLKENLKQVASFGSILAGIIVVSIGLTIGVAALPIAKGELSADLLKQRVARFSGESAVSSRYAQIRPLLESIQNHPMLGSGFGTQVTYASEDPRVLKNNADGLYTTTSFELGWLEIWLKIGLLGVFVYLYLLWCIIKSGWQQARHLERSTSEVERSRRYLILGGIIGLIAVILTHGVSPYLNHPLGIGVVMLMSIIVSKKKQ